VTTSGTETLALHGGDPVRTEPMPPRLAFIGEEDMRVLDGFLEHYRARRQDFGYQDTYERRYSEAFVRSLGVPGFADAVSTGTAALYVAVAAMQLPPGSRVLVSPITDPGTLSAIILNRLVPVLIDSAPNTPNAAAEQVAERVSPDTAAIVLVHAAGKAAEVGPIAALAREQGILLLEDCSQAHGARSHGGTVGTFGELAAFSTMYRKAHATGGSGGVVFAPTEEWYRRVRAHADRGKPSWEPGFDDKDPTTFLFPALNLNLDELSCALGLRSLEKLPRTIASRVAFLELLREQLEQASEICVGTPVSDEDSPFYYPIQVDVSRLRCSKSEFALAVRAEGVDLNPDYRYVVGEWPWAREHLGDDFDTPNARSWRSTHFNILFNENYGPREAYDIVQAIVKVERVLAA
jgi:perosamine synthetase